MNTTTMSIILMMILSGDCGLNDPRMILSMGDSITSGENVRPQERYPARLQAMTDKTVMNHGVGGSTTTYGLLNIRSFMERHRPHIVTILYGVNDIGARPVPNIETNLRTMIQYVKDNESVPIIATLTPITSGRWIWRAPFVRELNHRIRNMARDEEVLLVDLEAAFGWNTRHFPDGLHPNSQGMAVIANAFLQAIQQVPDCEE